MTPPGGFDEDTPRLRHMLDADELISDESEGGSDLEEYQLLDGDVLMAKVTLATQTADGDAWVTYGVQTRVMAGESEGAAFNRLSTITTVRAVQQTAMVEEAVAERAHERSAALRENRITPRG